MNFQFRHSIIKHSFIATNHIRKTHIKTHHQRHPVEWKGHARGRSYTVAIVRDSSKVFIWNVFAKFIIQLKMLLLWNHNWFNCALSAFRMFCEWCGGGGTIRQRVEWLESRAEGYLNSKSRKFIISSGRIGLNRRQQVASAINRQRRQIMNYECHFGFVTSFWLKISECNWWLLGEMGDCRCLPRPEPRVAHCTNCSLRVQLQSSPRVTGDLHFAHTLCATEMERNRNAAREM